MAHTAVVEVLYQCLIIGLDPQRQDNIIGMELACSTGDGVLSALARRMEMFQASIIIDFPYSFPRSFSSVSRPFRLLAASGCCAVAY